jgi:archaemetzincin
MYKKFGILIVVGTLLTLLLAGLGLHGIVHAQSRNIGAVSKSVVGLGKTNETWAIKPRMRQLAKEVLPQTYEKLKPIHTLKAKPVTGDWLYHHTENGVSVKAYMKGAPIRPNGRFKTIYIQPLGSFTKEQKKIVRLSGEYMAIYFNVPVKIQKPLPLSIVPRDARRRRFGSEQILSPWVLNMLRPRRPKDALAYIAFTASDLWPGRGWNFVYGQASLRSRVGVWSIHRNGDPSESKEMYELCLRRTIKTATHETGHILTINHCIAYSCNMNGCNHRDESDACPLALCPLCLYKICWNTRSDPIKRCGKLADFCKEHGLKDAEAFFRKEVKIMKGSL